MTPFDAGSSSPPRADKPNFLTHTTFTELNLSPLVLSGVSEAGFSRCTPIQAQTLPVSLLGRDVAGQAQTGTGKTAAFLITVFTRLLAAKDRELAELKSTRRRTRAAGRWWSRLLGKI